MAQPADTLFLVMPEWQGSASSRAMLIADGAAVLREDLPQASRVDVPVPAHAGDALGTPVARLSSLVSARDAARQALAGHLGPAITLGGDCASTLAGVERAVAADPTVAVLWCDAHPDLQVPSTSPSGAAAGMALAHALGRGGEDLNAATPTDPARVLLVGTREWDPEEAATVAELHLATLAEGAGSGTAGSDPEAEPPVVAWLREVGATSLYVHVDLDVLDPAEFTSVHQAVPFGLTVQELTALIRAAVAHVPLMGAAICQFAPADPAAAEEDAPTVLRLLAALTSGGVR